MLMDARRNASLEIPGLSSLSAVQDISSRAFRAATIRSGE
jgi:hypothetical protein